MVQLPYKIYWESTAVGISRVSKPYTSNSKPLVSAYGGSKKNLMDLQDPET